MSIPKDIAKKIGHFHSVSPDELEDFHEHVEWLEALLHEPCSIWEEDDGELVLIEIRQLVERVNGLKIEIYSNEHPPPHFHVKSPNINASFCIENCDKINGKISRGDYLKMNRRHSRLSDLRSKAKRLNLHSMLTILHYPTGHALTITQTTFLSEWHLGHLPQ